MKHITYRCYESGGFEAFTAEQWATCAGVKDIGKDVSCKLGVTIISIATYGFAPSVTFVTKVVRVVKVDHNYVCFDIECIEDYSNIAYLPFDLVLFGKDVPDLDDLD